MLKLFFKKIVDVVPLKLITALVDYRYRNAVISYSQNGEDIVLHHIFLHKKNGFYIDVGAHHPQRFSNTYLLYKKGWSGINIDPIPGMEDSFKGRTGDINLSIGVSDRKAEMSYYVFNKGALNTFDKEVAMNHTKDGVGIEKTIQIPVTTLADVVSKYANTKQVDFLNIDVEGKELEVLLGNDWNLCTPYVIAVEDHHFNFDTPEASAMYSFLKEKGYTLFSKMNYTTIYTRI